MSSLLANLEVVCQTCDVLNAPGGQICAGCRQPLADGPRASVPLAQPKPSPSSATTVPPGMRPSARPTTGPQPPQGARLPTGVIPASVQAPGVAHVQPNLAPAPQPAAPAPAAQRAPIPVAADPMAPRGPISGSRAPTDPGGLIAIPHPAVDKSLTQTDPAGTAALGSAPRAPAQPAAPPRLTPVPIPASDLLKSAPVPASDLLKAAPAAKPAAVLATAPALAPAAVPRFGLVVVAGPTKGQRFRLPASGVVIGKSRGAILFPDDPHLSPQHASVLQKEGRLFVRDDAGMSGVYATISGQEALAPNSFFCVGARLFRYVGPLAAPTPPAAGQPVGYGSPVPPGQPLYRVEEFLVGGRAGPVHVAPGPSFSIGLSNCELTFPNEEGMAARHCELSPTAAGATLRDLSGGLGTFVRLARGVDRPLRPGDRFRVGQQVLQVESLAA